MSALYREINQDSSFKRNKKGEGPTSRPSTSDTRTDAIIDQCLKTLVDKLKEKNNMATVCYTMGAA